MFPPKDHNYSLIESKHTEMDKMPDKELKSLLTKMIEDFKDGV